ncbi:hypothetical protein GF412_04645 [Candidatus Micrarchaeota archaeon]|nr:hypothetical protein [Candidatus Micrarchaeota archaeon]MBD3418241.1 hypothetical protein [Candidatus Micrarchaeota archaeon]
MQKPRFAPTPRAQNPKQPNKKLNRREFLKAARRGAAALGGLAILKSLPGCGTESTGKKDAGPDASQDCTESLETHEVEKGFEMGGGSLQSYYAKYVWVYEQGPGCDWAFEGIPVKAYLESEESSFSQPLEQGKPTFPLEFLFGGSPLPRMESAGLEERALVLGVEGGSILLGTRWGKDHEIHASVGEEGSVGDVTYKVLSITEEGGKYSARLRVSGYETDEYDVASGDYAYHENFIAKVWEISGDQVFFCFCDPYNKPLQDSGGEATSLPFSNLPGPYTVMGKYTISFSQEGGSISRISVERAEEG